jgi:hypothetical protein
MAIKRIIFQKPHLIFFGLLLQSAMSKHVAAQPLDDVSLEYQEAGIVATIRLTAPVRYLRHFPASHGKVLEIFYERVPGATSNEPWVDNEVRKSPPSTLIPGFTVTTRNQTTKPKLVVEFDRDADYSVSPGKDNRSLQITIRPDRLSSRAVELPILPTVKPERTTPPGATLTEDEANLAENNKKARVLMLEARDAMVAGNNVAAVDAFNKLLLLPPNDYTQDGQEWVGVARERSGQIDKARIEYDLYLKIYPEGEGAVRVAQRLTGLAGLPATTKPGTTTAAKVTGETARWISYASISPHYYYSRSKIDSTVIFNNTPTSSSLSMVDQSMLITNLDATQRYVSEEYDGRMVISDVNTLNFVASQPSQNRLIAAYADLKSRSKGYSLRLGRQSSYGGGVLGRFDGITASYGIAQETSINAVAGALSDFTYGSKPTFVGASVIKGPVTLYAINQQVEGTTDRRAMGAEFRYFEVDRTAYALLDYDTYFNELNAAQVLGTLGAYGGTATFMLDHRRAPSLSIRNALLGASTSSVNDLLQTMSTESLRDLALARTATSNMAQIGISIPLQKQWQVSGDLRLMNTSGLPASGSTPLEGILPETPGRGTELSVMGQLVGNSLYTDNDIWSGSITLNTSSDVSGYSIYLYNYTLIGGGWTMNPSLQFYRFKDQFGTTTDLTSPMIRGTYRVRDRLNLDMDCGYEVTDSVGAQQTTKITRIFYSAGVRWDF